MGAQRSLLGLGATALAAVSFAAKAKEGMEAKEKSEKNYELAVQQKQENLKLTKARLAEVEARTANAEALNKAKIENTEAKTAAILGNTENSQNIANAKVDAINAKASIDKAKAKKINAETKQINSKTALNAANTDLKAAKTAQINAQVERMAKLAEEPKVEEAPITTANSETKIEIDEDVQKLQEVKANIEAHNIPETAKAEEPEQKIEAEKEPEAPNIVNLAKETIEPEEAINFDSDSESVVQKLAETKNDADFEKMLKDYNAPIFDDLRKLSKEKDEKVSEIYKNSAYNKLIDDKRALEDSVRERYYNENNIDKNFIRSFDNKYFDASPAGYGNLMDAAAGKITEEEYLKRASYFDDPKKIAKAKEALENIKQDPDLKEALRQRDITSWKPIDKIANEEELKQYNEINEKAEVERVNRDNKLEEVRAPYDEQYKKLESKLIKRDAAEAYRSNKETEKKYGVSHSSLTKYFAEHPDGEKVIKVGNTPVKFTRDDYSLVISTNKSHYKIPFIYQDDKISAVNNLQENKTLDDLLRGFKPYKSPLSETEKSIRVPKPKGKWYKVWSNNTGEEQYEFRYADENKKENK